MSWSTHRLTVTTMAAPGTGAELQVARQGLGMMTILPGTG